MESETAERSTFHSAQDGLLSSSSSFVLRELISDVPVEDEYITCVDAWNGNLYIGTSAGEVLHYVSLPGDSSSGPSFIFATKLQPSFTTQQEGRDAGVKQILLLPDVSKACILCNGTLTFYTLPELSPAFGGRIQQAGCLWVGGIDQDSASQQTSTAATPVGSVIVICLKQKLRLIRVGEEARSTRNIELGGVTTLQRRGDLACVSENGSYSLLDLVNQRKNELFPISSEVPAAATAPPPPEVLDQPSGARSKARETSQSFSATSPVRLSSTHERNISLDSTRRSRQRLLPDRESPWPARRSSRQIDSPPERSLSREPSPMNGSAVHTPHESVEIAAPNALQRGPLAPNIVSLGSGEFLVTIGTNMAEPGVGMFVNSDGDVVRGTLQFSSYPEHLVMEQTHSSTNDSSEAPSYALAVVRRPGEAGLERTIEIQNIDQVDSGSGKEWLPIGTVSAEQDLASPSFGLGLRLATDPENITMERIVSKLHLRRFPLKHSEQSMTSDRKREEEEDRFTSRFAQFQARLLFYQGPKVFWIMRNPLMTRLDSELSKAVEYTAEKLTNIHLSLVIYVMNSVRGQEARDELEFHTLAYIRQKCSLLFLGHLVLQTARGAVADESEQKSAEEALLAGEIDPRVILALVPALSEEVVSGDSGIWLPEGIIETASAIQTLVRPETTGSDPEGLYASNILQPVKRYLMTWRKKKGLASVADEAHVSRAVDAALLRILLMLDSKSTSAPARPGSARAELNKVVDDGVDCFDHAVELFEQFHRLYMLSRLYQSRTKTDQVLFTWKRIIEGEYDAGGEMTDGEQMVRRYLPKLRDQSLVQEYGCWLARRNAPLGVQVFADSKSKVKFEPTEALAMLRNGAPGAVKDYLEHLVFGKHRTEYADELIGFYVDSVVSELDDSKTSRELLLQTYSVYRSMAPPRPTYRQFITDNAIEAAWWQNRLRLLQLLDGTQGATLTYDLGGLRERLAAHEKELLPEVIVLYAREGRHDEALKLLTHGLADYDTAIRYCLREGSSIFHPSMDAPRPESETSREDQKKLFELLLHHLLQIEDEEERTARAAEVLDRFGGWFDIGRVIELVPETWPVEVVASFLVQALRKSLSERNETAVVKALSGAQNLRQAVDMIDKLEGHGATVVTNDELDTT